MHVTVIIPARYESSRYPGKALALVKGARGTHKTLIRRTWEAATRVAGISRIVVATDDQRIIEEVASFGGESVMTSRECRNGTERCCEASRLLGQSDGLIVNLQGDALLTPPWFIENLVAAYRNSCRYSVLTPVLRCDPEGLASLVRDRKAGRVGATTAVFGADNQALYFSKELIPWSDQSSGMPEQVCHHVGVYAYTSKALSWYMDRPPGRLELIEGLEQLRFLEHGMSVGCVEVEAMGKKFWELNNPSDLPIIEEYLRLEDVE